MLLILQIIKSFEVQVFHWQECLKNGACPGKGKMKHIKLLFQCVFCYLLFLLRLQATFQHSEFWYQILINIILIIRVYHVLNHAGFFWPKINTIPDMINSDNMNSTESTIPNISRTSFLTHFLVSGNFLRDKQLDTM